MTDNGNYLFWITEPESDPDAWRIASNEARGHDWYTFDGTLTNLLTALLSGEFHVSPLRTSCTRAPPSRPGAETTQRRLRTPIGRSVDTKAIREWGRANGHELLDRGRVPAARGSGPHKGSDAVPPNGALLQAGAFGLCLGRARGGRLWRLGAV
ncbi:Lsr2 family DNA-binding protein [Streptomyces canus]|uniref:Lsr2 family DNA-binding protein n=1 Tax=Streptomyces canus TaxID=58343 RepID=UPI003D9A64FF